MFYLVKPTAKEIEHLIETQSELPFSYKDVGATKDRKPPGFFQSIIIEKSQEMVKKFSRKVVTRFVLGKCMLRIGLT